MSGENVTGTRTEAIAVFGHKPSSHTAMVARPTRTSTPSESILHFCIVISSRVAVSSSNDIEAAEVRLDRRAGVEVKARIQASDLVPGRVQFPVRGLESRIAQHSGEVRGRVLQLRVQEDPVETNLLLGGEDHSSVDRRERLRSIDSLHSSQNVELPSPVNLVQRRIRR